jgi:uncharacterized protein YjiS (DUF1127 family)
MPMDDVHAGESGVRRRSHGTTSNHTEFIMSTTSNAALRGSAAGGGLLQAIGTTLRGSWAAYVARRQQRLAIDRLHAMSDHQLKDIGLSRSQIESAVRGDRDRLS